MTKEIWLNLPVKNLNKSKEFFTQLGFSFNPLYENSDEAVCLIVGDKSVIVMLFEDATFKSFTLNGIADTKKVSEVLISIDAESKEEVDEMAKKVILAGGTIYYEPEDQGWMYGCGFADLDGHRWNVLYMDMENMPQE